MKTAVLELIEVLKNDGFKIRKGHNYTSINDECNYIWYNEPWLNTMDIPNEKVIKGYTIKTYCSESYAEFVLNEYLNKYFTKFKFIENSYIRLIEG